MDIAFSLRSQLEKVLTLQDALVKDTSEAISALLFALNDLIFARSLIPKKRFLSSLDALETQQNRFYDALSNVNFNGFLTVKEEKVIQGGYDGVYYNDDVEGEFFKYGGSEGIFALILFFREGQTLERQWQMTIEGARMWLVKRVSSMLRKDLVHWIHRHSKRRVWHDPIPLQFLGKDPGRRKRKHAMQAAGNPNISHTLKSSVPFDQNPYHLERRQTQRADDSLASKDDSSNPPLQLPSSSSFTFKNSESTQLLTTLTTPRLPPINAAGQPSEIVLQPILTNDFRSSLPHTSAAQRVTAALQVSGENTPIPPQPLERKESVEMVVHLPPILHRPDTSQLQAPRNVAAHGLQQLDQALKSLLPIVATSDETPISSTITWDTITHHQYVNKGFKDLVVCPATFTATKAFPQFSEADTSLAKRQRHILNEAASEGGFTPSVRKNQIEDRIAPQNSLNDSVDNNRTFNNEQDSLCSSASTPYLSQQPKQDYHQPINDSPLSFDRETKFMFSNAPAHNIWHIPEPFKKAIVSSRQWQWERSLGLKTTSCWSTLFPKNLNQDVSFTFWCSLKEGSQLIQLFGGRCEISC